MQSESSPRAPEGPPALRVLDIATAFGFLAALATLVVRHLGQPSGSMVVPGLLARLADFCQLWLAGIFVAAAAFYFVVLARRLARRSGLVARFEKSFASIRVSNVDNCRAVGLGILLCATMGVVLLTELNLLKELARERWTESSSPAEMKMLMVALGLSAVIAAVLVPTVWVFSAAGSTKLLQSRSGRRRSRWVAATLLPLLVFGSLLPRLHRAPYGNGVSVVLVVVDCLRADHLGVYGYKRNAAPNIGTISRDAVIFELAVSQANWTKPSIASIFTSLYPSEHQVLEGALAGDGGRNAAKPVSDVLNGRFETLAERLASAGFQTGGFVNQAHLADYLGFAQGYEFYDSSLDDARLLPTFETWLQRTPFFAYLHYLSLHYPYLPPEEADVFSREDGKIARMIRDDPGQFSKIVQRGDVQLTLEDRDQLVDLYDGELLGVDRRIGELATYLKQNGLYDNTMLIITADHGEELLEHGYLGHGGTHLYSELVRVPLILKLPGNRYAGKRVDAPVQLIDIMPTVLDFLGLGAPTESSGHSLRAVIEGTSSRPPPVLSEAESSTALYANGYKFVFGSDPANVQVFHYVTDRADQRDIAKKVDDAIIRDAWSTVEEFKTRSGEFAARYPREEQTLKEEEVERLKALGYIETGQR